MEFRDRLKSLRQKKGISQEALAKAIYVSRSAVAKWENGSGIPSDDNLQALCDYFGVEEDWILDRRDLKRQITFGKWQTAIPIVALLGIVTVVIYVLLGFSLRFHWDVVTNMPMVHQPWLYQSVPFFKFVVHRASNVVAFILLCASVAVWAVHVLFALSSVAIPALKKHYRMCLWGNLGFILLSAGLFLSLLLVTVQAAAPLYEL